MWNATIQSNISSFTQTPTPDSSHCDVTHPVPAHSPPPCFTPNVSHPDIDPLCFCLASNISIPITSLTNSTLGKVIHASTTVINRVYVSTVSIFFYALFSPTYATLYCIDLFPKVSNWMVEKYKEKWADIPIDIMWNATIQSNISSLTQTPTPDPDVAHHASVHSPPTCFTPNVSHPDIDPLCFCPASNISIPIMTSFPLDPVIKASTTFIKRVYVWTVSTMLYALHSPTNATLYCINTHSTISDWKIYNTDRNTTDYFTSTQFITRRSANPTSVIAQGCNPLNTTTGGVDSAEVPIIDLRELAIVNSDMDIGHVVIFIKEFGVIDSVMDMLVQWSLWLLDNVSGYIRMTDVAVMVVMIAYFYLMRQREQKLKTDLKEKSRREVIGILADKKALRSRITSFEKQLVKEKGLRKKAKSSLLVKLQACELKIYQMNSDFLNGQEYFESVIVDANNKIMNAEREAEMKLKEAKKEAETMLSEAMEKNKMEHQTVTQECEEALRKEMEAGEKRLSRVDRQHQRELFKTKAELYRLREKNQLLRGTEEKLFLAEKKLQDSEDKLALNIGLHRSEIDNYKMLIDLKRCNSQPSCSALEPHSQNDTSLVSTSSSLQQILDKSSKKLFSYFSSSNSTGRDDKDKMA